jgi:hypothetical protein
MADFTFYMGPITKTDIMETIKTYLHNASPDMADFLLQDVRDKTPVDTSALLAGEIADPPTDPSDPVLIYVHSSAETQLDEWGRVYVQYQEGGVLGMPTYTNAPHMMFRLTATQDLPAVASWAVYTVQDALDACKAGNGIPLP